MGKLIKIKDLQTKLATVHGSAKIIFARPDKCDKIKLMFDVIRQLRAELELPLRYDRVYLAVSESQDGFDFMNQATFLAQKTQLAELIFTQFASAVPDEFQLAHAKQLLQLPELLRAYIDILQANVPLAGLSRLHPDWYAPLLEETQLTNANVPADLAPAIAGNDPFAGGRVLRYEHNEFMPVELLAARKLDEFYGYGSVRNIFAAQFKHFAEARPVAPMFITSLPGLGKTALTLSYALANPELTLILPSPDALQENLPGLLKVLRQYPQHRFVLFYDDIDPREINWYNFRTHIGGSFAMPGNVTLVIAANFDFPPNVLSRGRTVTFPIFDELRCMDMITDYLIQHKLRNPDPNLAAVIAADYVEEFGQKKFTELSPRTLIRYLDFYISDREKRRRMLELSHQELIIKPDAQLFYEENIKLMRSLYGDGYIEELLKEKLRKLGDG